MFWLPWNLIRQACVTITPCLCEVLFEKSLARSTNDLKGYCQPGGQPVMLKSDAHICKDGWYTGT